MVDFFLISRSVERLDLETDTWIPVESMLSRRSTLGVAVLKGELYAVGGFDGNNGLDTVEKYNPGMTTICPNGPIKILVDNYITL